MSTATEGWEVQDDIWTEKKDDEGKVVERTHNRSAPYTMHMSDSDKSLYLVATVTAVVVVIGIIIAVVGVVIA